jgi:peptidyl-prolyl cis-trans isomerase SurA
MKNFSGVVIALALASAALMPLRAEIIEQVLVKVNGEIITKTELESRQIEIIRSRMKQDVTPESIKNDDQLKKLLAEVTPQILVEVIDEMLMVQLAKERGYRLRDEQFKEWLAALRKEQNLLDDEKFMAALKQEGMTIDDLRRNVERQFMVSQVQREEVGSKLSITEEEARQYYLNHPHEFTTASNVTLREILIEIPAAKQKGQVGINVAQDDDARARAAEIRQRIVAGEDFGKVAGELSMAASKSNGGLIGPITISELSESLQQMLKRMKPGEVSAPVRTNRGYQILKLETLKEAALQSFDSVRDEVAERVHTERQRQEIRKFVTRLRSQAIVEWKNQELKKAYEQLISQSVPGQG